ncbi:uncharacterized protein LOC123867014 [Maniola jurtina]|uniref:uncharacterized protein LOC123867014 n=1 Tax=Maniola jurtina TaxID=191418 RepID=UPI001E68EBD2|nr:uncharacterized protein LOC123867014 [Maniola jurtina]XP_045764807.1 uncharacterized protein LOC123867014 [Maniola jurtina]
MSLKLKSNNNWALCPVDILLVVFKKLDIKSLLNCMNVNIYWRNTVEYYCEHVNLWKAMLQNAIDDEGVTFAEKSNLGEREQFLIAQQWYNVTNTNVCLRHCYKFDSSIRNIYVHKDNLIVVTNNAVKYFNIMNFEHIKVIDKSCVRYEETSSMIVELLVAPEQKLSPLLTLTNKLHANYVDSENVKQIILKDIDSYIVHLNSCYEYSCDRVLWMHTAKEIGWETKAMAKYHGIQQFCSLHIYKKNVYILLKCGSVLTPDTECNMLVFLFRFPEQLIDWKPFMFHECSLLFKAPAPSERSVALVQTRRHNSFVKIMPLRDGVTCVLEHGHILILGREDGMIEIYLTRKLMDPSEANFPELKLNLMNYLCKPEPKSELSLRITALEIHEDIYTGHHLFVSTMFNIYELLL